MKQAELDFFYTWFKEYVKGFYGDDKSVNFNIQLKEEHTQRVCQNMIQIGESITLDSSKMVLAQTIALFHDVGRFEQFKKYRTFSDGKSENHALLGIKVLSQTQILDCLSEEDKELIFKAISYHNVCTIPDSESEECILFSRMIRDADKLDIFDILAKFYKEPDKYPYLAVSETSMTTGYARSIIDDLLSGRNILYSNIKTSDEMKLLRLSWVYDINFDYTLRKVKDKKFIETIIQALPKDEKILKVYEHIRDYMDHRLAKI